MLESSYNSSNCFMSMTLNNFTNWNIEINLILKLENNEPKANHVI